VRLVPHLAIGLRHEIIDGLNAFGAIGRGNDCSFGNIGFVRAF